MVNFLILIELTNKYGVITFGCYTRYYHTIIADKLTSNFQLQCSGRRSSLWNPEMVIDFLLYRILMPSVLNCLSLFWALILSIAGIV